jgi:ubiquinone/menaquinone biosynthesis C-methylase UbiE
MKSEEKIFNPKKWRKLEHPDRYKEIPPAKLLQDLELSEGQVFGDYGCGIGFFSIPAAEKVGKTGHVYASDISAQMLEGLRERLDPKFEDRVTTCLAGAENSNNSTGIAVDSIDVGMISTVLHEVDHVQVFLKDVAETLKEGGRLGIVEWNKIKMDKGPRIKIRISEDELESLLNASGFRLIRTEKLSDRFYFALAKKV